MILVLNLNPYLNKRYEIADMVRGEVIRVRQTENIPGGKGIYVANVITRLNEKCIITGLLGGKSGEFIEKKLDEYIIKHDFVKINEETRSCLTIISDDFVQTEIQEPEPEVSGDEQYNFLDKYIDLIKDANFVVGSGDVPINIPNNFYRKLIEMANAQGKKFLLDTHGGLLKEGIKGKPYFIKLNKDEIEDLIRKKITNEEDMIIEIKKLQSKGIEIVAISLGIEGSFTGYKGKFYKVSIPKVKVTNPSGLGDSCVAGVAVAIQRRYKIEDILKFASACETANAMEKYGGFVTESAIDELIDRITVEEL